jgi:predicted amidohydrolase YtcJ
MKVLHNVLVHKMDTDFSTATALAWEEGTIAAVGEAGELLKRYPDAGRIDGDGRSVLPGFIDPHIHFAAGLLMKGALDLSPERAPTLEAAMELLRESAARLSAGRWVVGQGYDPWQYDDKRVPTRGDLDRACPDHPALIIHYSGHEGVANSRALHLADITRDTPAPFAGEVKKDRNGEPNGHLVELAMGPVELMARTDTIERTRPDLLRRLAAEQQSLYRCGVTRFADPATSTELEAIYREALEGGYLKPPLHIYPGSDRGQFELPWDALDRASTGSGDDRLRVGPLKIFLDGADRCAMSLSARQIAATTAATMVRAVRGRSLDPIRASTRSPVRPGRDLRFHAGILTTDVGECRRLAASAVDRGFTLAFHAIGNEAIAMAVDAIESCRERHAAAPPPRIEHGLFLDDRLIRRIADLGIAIVTQPYLLTHMDSENVPFLPGLRQMPLRSLMQAGVRVSGSSDWPVAPYQPLLAIERAVTRVTRGDERLQPEESISINRALSMYTREAAHAIGCETEAGTLEKGKRADFIMLSDNPLEVREGEWGGLRVTNTWLAGEAVFESSS